MAIKRSGSASFVGAGATIEAASIQKVGQQVTFLPPVFIPQAPAPVRVTVPDNTLIIEKVDFSGLLGTLKRPTRTVVVGQTPAPGDQVPLGTQVTLTLAVKEILPLSGFGLLDQVRNKFATAGDLVSAVDGATDAPNVKDVFASGKPYAELSDAERTAADGFTNQLGQLSGDDRARAYEDVAFVYRF